LKSRIIFAEIKSYHDISIKVGVFDEEGDDDHEDEEDGWEVGVGQVEHVDPAKQDFNLGTQSEVRYIVWQVIVKPLASDKVDLEMGQASSA